MDMKWFVHGMRCASDWDVWELYY